MNLNPPMNKNPIPSPHILIVDDDPDQLRLLVAALRNTSYRVSVALDGDQGYARAAALAPDLILLDVSMPGQNGLTVARLLKANSATRAIPIIFLSARADDQERLTGLKTGAVDYREPLKTPHSCPHCHPTGPTIPLMNQPEPPRFSWSPLGLSQTGMICCSRLR